MQLLVWNPDWETGAAEVDEQHRQLLALFDELLVAMHENQPEPLIQGLLGFLATYVEAHFAEEEALMQAIHYQHLAEHQRIHQAMRARIRQVIQTRTQLASATLETLEFLTEWLMGHINNEDRAVVRHCRMHPTGSQNASLPGRPHGPASGRLRPSRNPWPRP